MRAVEALNLFLWDSPENVRSAKVPYSQWDKEPASIMAQPLRIGPRLMQKLNVRNRVEAARMWQQMSVSRLKSQ